MKFCLIVFNSVGISLTNIRLFSLQNYQIGVKTDKGDVQITTTLTNNSL